MRLTTLQCLLDCCHRLTKKNPKEKTMDDAPVVLGVNRTQDAGICLMHGSQLVWAIRKERLTRHKHHRGTAGDFRDVYVPRLPGLERPVDVLVECFSADTDASQLPAYEAELAETLRFAPGCRRLRISRHMAHAYSAFPPSPFREAAVMVAGGQGSPVAELTEHWSGAGEVPGTFREVSSFYRADRARIECIGKQVWDRDDSRPVGLGMFCSLLAQAMFAGEGNEGKVMELAPHGSPLALGLPPLAVDGARVSIPAAWRALLGERGRFRYGAPGAGFSDCANLAAAGQRAFEEALLQVAHWLHAQTGLDNLCFAGGAALNCSANQRLLRETPFRHVFVAPAPGAAGTALGCALYGLEVLAGQRCEWRWPYDYLGPEPALSDIEESLFDAPDLVVERLPGRDALSARMLDLLCANKVVGLYQGRSEFGPRALGHRSIIGNPRHRYVRDWINARVKQREWFRPLAPVVLQERADEFFDLPGASPFMQFAVPVRPAAAALLPAVTHVDGTARLQTVGPHDDPLLRTLLAGFAARTGLPVLLHTSFNGKDEPLVESPAEALATFRRMPLHALAMPPFLVKKRVEPELPE
jgi:carbamoyltransferase